MGVISSSLGCQVTLAELKALNPRAATLEVPCRPSEIPDNVTVMAFASESGHIVTDEDQNELLSFAPSASVFIRFDDAARPESLAIMAAEYGLSCPKMVENYGPPSEALAKAPASVPRIAVCARPPGITVNEWYGGVPGTTGARTISNATGYENRIAKASAIFYFDANASPESVWNFGKDTKVRCPGKAPMPFDEWVAKNAGTASQQSGSTNSATPTTTTTTTTTTKPNGGGETTSKSSPTGEGPPLSTLETIAHNLAIAGALAQADTSGQLKNPNGHRNGIPGGKNVGGFSFPPLQAGVAILQILSSAGLSPKSFVDDIVKFAKRGQRTLIKEADAKMMQVADDLIKSTSQYEMAKGLQEMETIMPFELGQKFTASLGGKFQAHKIFERRAIKHFMKKQRPGLSDEALEKAVDEVAKKYPSIILTKEEHDIISNALAAQWRAVPNPENITKEQLREIYKNVYKAKPHWLEAIESYLR